MNLHKLPVFNDPSRELVVITSVTPWDEPPRLRHQVTRSLCKYYNVLYVQTYPKKRGITKKETASLIITSVGLSIRGMSRLFTLIPVLEWLFKSRIAAAVSNIVSKIGYHEAKIINFNFDFHEVFDQSIFVKKLFIYNDDFIGRVNSHRQYARAEKRLKLLLEKATASFAVSDALVNVLSQYGENIYLLRHAVEFFDVAEAVCVPQTRRSEGELNIGYMGYINRRLNTEWMKFILSNKNIRLFLIGPIDDKSMLDQFYLYDNFQYVSPLFGRDLVVRLTNMDVLIMPYDIEGSNRNVVRKLAPNKMFVYLNAGRPIVAAKIPYFAEFPPQFVYSAESKEQFLDLIYLAANEDTIDRKKERVFFAKANSWESRIQVLLPYLAAESEGLSQIRDRPFKDKSI